MGGTVRTVFYSRSAECFYSANPVISSGFRGRAGGGGLSLFPQEFDPLPTQRVLILYLFEISIFGDGPENFSKGVLGANIY